MTLSLLMIGILGLLFAAMLAFPLASRPVAGAGLVMGCFLMESILITPPGISLGLMIYPPDVVFVLIFLAVLLRYLLGMAHFDRVQVVIAVLFALFFLAVVRGFVKFGIKPSGVEARTMFCYFAGVFYFASFKLGSRLRERILTVWLATSLALVAICVLRWAAVIAGLSIAATWQETYGAGFRVTTADSACVLGLSFFASMFMHIRGTGPLWQRKLHYIFGPVVLLLQHRTVWVMMLVGFLWLGTQDKRFRRQAIAGVVTLAVLGTVAVMFLFGSRSQELLNSLQYSASNEDTFMWRVAGWYQLLFANQARTPLNDLFGQPFGTGFPRWIGGSLVDTAPHNYYLEILLRTGIAGLALWLWLYRWGIRRMKKMSVTFRRAVYPDSRFWALTLILQLVFSIGYGIQYEQTILTGLALAGLALRRPRPAANQPTSAVPSEPAAPNEAPA